MKLSDLKDTHGYLIILKKEEYHKVRSQKEEMDKRGREEMALSENSDNEYLHAIREKTSALKC